MGIYGHIWAYPGLLGITHVGFVGFALSLDPSGNPDQIQFTYQARLTVIGIILSVPRVPRCNYSVGSLLLPTCRYFICT